MATSTSESDGDSEHTIEINGTHDMKCATCFKKGEENGAVGICKECKYYLCRQCVEDHRTEHNKQHRIAFFYCETTLKANKLVRADSFCLDCGHYLCQKCRLDHGGFRQYRHHTFIGGNTLPGDLFQHEMTRHNVPSPRCSRKTISGIARRSVREVRTKSPYLSRIGNTLVNVPKQRTVSVDELVGQKVVQKQRTLIYSTTGRKPRRDTTLKTPENEKKHRTKAGSVHYEDDQTTDKADLVGEYDLKGQTDKEKCQIIASVFLENDKLVVADQGNKNIKLYDSQFTYKSSMHLVNFPVALCPSKQVISELFASSGNTLFLIGTHQELTLIRKIDTNAPKIEGLAPWEFGIAIVFKSMRSKTDRKGKLEVHLMTYEGEVKYEIIISSQCSVRMVTPIWYITTTNDGSELLLSDTNLNRIISIDISNWHVVYVLRGKTKGGAPRSLAMDPDGNLLVSWYGEVHKISQFGKDLGVPVSDIDKQSIIVYNQRTKNLVVHSWTKTQSDRFRVYQLN